MNYRSWFLVKDFQMSEFSKVMEDFIMIYKCSQKKKVVVWLINMCDLQVAHQL